MLLEFIVDLIVWGISRGGYGAIFFLMMLESMVAPVPSEAVMPFAGFLVARGEFNIFWVAVASSLGSVAGSLLSYYIGFYGGRVAVLKFGKYLFLKESHLVWTHAFFEKYGEPAILVGRFIPVVRHLISIPAGIGRMNVFKFSLYTLVGATSWNLFLTYTGMRLEENWDIIEHYSLYIDILVLMSALLSAFFYFWKHGKKD